MKKYYFLFCSFVLIGIGATNAQLTNLHVFTGTDGKAPHGSLIVSGNKFFGMTTAGGANNEGVIFSIDTNGTGYNVMYSFSSTSGHLALGHLTLAGNKLYGMTCLGPGSQGQGVIFSIDTNGNNYTIMYSFTGANASNGANPEGSLTLLGGKLFGVTSYNSGGSSSILFSIDTNGSGFSQLYLYPSTNGDYLEGSLVLLGHEFFGMTSVNFLSGSNGNIYSIDTNGNGFSSMYNLGNTNYNNLVGSLAVSGNKLFGTTDTAGVTNHGSIFSIDTNSIGIGYKTLYNFNDTDGSSPYGALTLFGNELYGMTYDGGAFGEGVIFSINVNGTGYKVLYNLNDTNSISPCGYHPYGSLTVLGNYLYGMTSGGGSTGDGTIFKLKLSSLTSINELTSIGNMINVFPNPSNRVVNIDAPVNITEIQIENIMGQCVSNGIYNTKKVIEDISALSPGIYFIKINDTYVKKIVKE